ncbi:MAG: hypothetical protein R8L53_01865 [Mariprofundales bacterium]
MNIDVNNAVLMSSLLGRKVCYLGIEYLIIEIITEESLMIIGDELHTSVQDDCFGRAHRLTPRVQRLYYRDKHGHPSHVWHELHFMDGE